MYQPREDEQISNEEQGYKSTQYLKQLGQREEVRKTQAWRGRRDIDINDNHGSPRLPLQLRSTPETPAPFCFSFFQTDLETFWFVPLRFPSTAFSSPTGLYSCFRLLRTVSLSPNFQQLSPITLTRIAVVPGPTAIYRSAKTPQISLGYDTERAHETPTSMKGYNASSSFSPLSSSTTLATFCGKKAAPIIYRNWSVRK